MWARRVAVQVEAIAESKELVDDDEGKPYLGSTAAVLLNYDPPQTQDTGAASQVGSALWRVGRGSAEAGARAVALPGCRSL